MYGIIITVISEEISRVDIDEIGRVIELVKER